MKELTNPTIALVSPSRGRFGPVGALSLGSALLALAVLVGLSLTSAGAHAAFPGSNGKIACHGPGDRTLANPDADDFEIFTINPDGGGRTLLTNNGPFFTPGDPRSGLVQDAAPAFSPDGKKVAFESTRTGSGTEIFSINIDGTGIRRLTAAIGDDGAPHFSPDGRQIVFTSARNDQQNEVYKMDADGSNQTRLTTNPGGNDGRASWSPDGTKIAFETARPNSAGEQPSNGIFFTQNTEIATMNPDGTGVTLLTDTQFPVSNRSTRWSPDGKQIVFESDRAAPAANIDIYKMNRDGSGVTRLTTNVGTPGVTGSATDQLPQFSPDGTKIVFDSGRNRAAPTPPETSAPANTEVYTINPDGSGETRVTNVLGTDSRCDWQPIPRPGDVFRGPGGGGATPGGGRRRPGGGPRTGGGARIRPNLSRPRGSARRSGRRIVVRVRGRMRGTRGRSCIGRVKIRVRFARNRHVTRIARMGRNCRYSKRVSFPVSRLPRALRARDKTLTVRVAARFQGNAALLPDVSKTRRMKVRR